MKHSIFLLALFLTALVFFSTINNALANATGVGAGNASAGTVKLTNPLTGDSNSKSIPELLGTIINYAMGIIGSLALVMFIYGGITWMLSGGSSEKVTKGKDVIIWATLGLALIFAAYALVKFVLTVLSGT